MRSLEARQWFAKTQNIGGAGATNVIAGVAGKIPVVIYCSVTVVATGLTLEITGTSSGTPILSVDNTVTGPRGAMGPLFSGILLASGDGVTVTTTGGGSSISVTVEGYYNS